MEIWTLAGFGLVGTVLCLLIRHYRPELGMILSVCCGILIFTAALLNLTPVLDKIEEYIRKASLEQANFAVLLKSLGICYIASIAGDSCRDAGQTAIAGKIELAAKIAIVVLALPLFDQVLSYALDLISI